MLFYLYTIFNLEFVRGSLQHVFPIIFGAVISSLIIYFAKYRCTLKEQRYVFNVLGLFVSLSVLCYHLYLISKGHYNIKTDLPLFICSSMALFIFIFTYFRNYLMYEILLFWIIAGTTHGVITPDIPNNFPNPDFFRYWIVHLGLILIVLYATIVLKMLPTIKSIFKSFLALQVYIILLFSINYVLESNYSYLNEKPASISILDYLGSWPSYIFVVEIVLIPYFLVIYLPFHLLRKFCTARR